MHAVGANEKVASRGRAVFEQGEHLSSIDRREFLQPLEILNLDALPGRLLH